MNTDNKFPEQEAPAKNTDNAFVQVGEDGAPAIPPASNNNTAIKDEEHTTTPDKR